MNETILGLIIGLIGVLLAMARLLVYSNRQTLDATEAGANQNSETMESLEECHEKYNKLYAEYIKIKYRNYYEKHHNKR